MIFAQSLDGGGSQVKSTKEKRREAEVAAGYVPEPSAG